MSACSSVCLCQFIRLSANTGNHKEAMVVKHRHDRCGSKCESAEECCVNLQYDNVSVDMKKDRNV